MCICKRIMLQSVRSIHSLNCSFHFPVAYFRDVSFSIFDELFPFRFHVQRPV